MINKTMRCSHPTFFRVHLHTWKTVSALLWIQQTKGVLDVFSAFVFFIWCHSYITQLVSMKRLP